MGYFHLTFRIWRPFPYQEKKPTNFTVMLYTSGCKINLGLYVTSKRPDGFHNIESVFYPIEWNDALEIEVDLGNNRCTMVEYNTSVTVDPTQNICFKAYHLLAEKFDLPAVKIHLYKSLPTGAGLGGGSANGSTTLKLLNNTFNLNLSNTELRFYASKLGSDCPFFIYNTPAYVSGRGEIMESIQLDLSEYYFVIVHPGVHVSTPEAYRLITPKPSTFNLKEEITATPIQNWKNVLHNDFEEPIATKFPIITEIKNTLYKNGALYSSMSGSGSAVYGIFETHQQALNAQERFKHFTNKLVFTENYINYIT